MHTSKTLTLPGAEYTEGFRITNQRASVASMATSTVNKTTFSESLTFKKH